MDLYKSGGSSKKLCMMISKKFIQIYTCICMIFYIIRGTFFLKIYTTFLFKGETSKNQQMGKLNGHFVGGDLGSALQNATHLCLLKNPKVFFFNFKAERLKFDRTSL